MEVGCRTAIKLWEDTYNSIPKEELEEIINNFISKTNIKEPTEDD